MTHLQAALDASDILLQFYMGYWAVMKALVKWDKYLEQYYLNKRSKSLLTVKAKKGDK